uniref:HMG box domain-containing protein n=1 Tax=Globodera rostochiensis TaxID=31243 RepID=A0A914HZU9_GLORO
MRSQYIVVKNEFCQEQQQRTFVAGGDDGNEREGRARFMRNVKTEWIAAGEECPSVRPPSPAASSTSSSSSSSIINLDDLEEHIQQWMHEDGQLMNNDEHDVQLLGEYQRPQNNLPSAGVNPPMSAAKTLEALRANPNGISNAILNACKRGNPFILFSATQRAIIRCSLSPEATFKQISEETARRWKTLPVAEKQVYKRHAKELQQIAAPEPKAGQIRAFCCLWNGCIFESNSESGLFQHISISHISLLSAPLFCMWRPCNRGPSKNNPFKSVTNLMKHIRERHGGGQIVQANDWTFSRAYFVYVPPAQQLTLGSNVKIVPTSNSPNIGKTGLFINHPYGKAPSQQFACAQPILYEAVVARLQAQKANEGTSEQQKQKQQQQQMQQHRLNDTIERQRQPVNDGKMLLEGYLRANNQPQQHLGKSTGAGMVPQGYSGSNNQYRQPLENSTATLPQGYSGSNNQYKQLLENSTATLPQGYSGSNNQCQQYDNNFRAVPSERYHGPNKQQLQPVCNNNNNNAIGELSEMYVRLTNQYPQHFNDDIGTGTLPQGYSGSNNQYRQPLENSTGTLPRGYSGSNNQYRQHLENNSTGTRMFSPGYSGSNNQYRQPLAISTGTGIFPRGYSGSNSQYRQPLENNSTGTRMFPQGYSGSNQYRQPLENSTGTRMFPQGYSGSNNQYRQPLENSTGTGIQGYSGSNNQYRQPLENSTGVLPDSERYSESSDQLQQHQPMNNSNMPYCQGAFRSTTDELVLEKVDTNQTLKLRAVLINGITVHFPASAEVVVLPPGTLSADQTQQIIIYNKKKDSATASRPSSPMTPLISSPTAAGGVEFQFPSPTPGNVSSLDQKRLRVDTPAEWQPSIVGQKRQHRTDHQTETMPTVSDGTGISETSFSGDVSPVPTVKEEPMAIGTAAEEEKNGTSETHSCANVKQKDEAKEGQKNLAESALNTEPNRTLLTDIDLNRLDAKATNLLLINKSLNSAEFFVAQSAKGLLPPGKKVN